MQPPKTKTVNKSRSRIARSSSSAAYLPFEGLESRQLLSSTVLTAHPSLSVSPMAATSIFQGYTAAQIRKAYGFDQLSATGAGQTIAIVDAFRDPNVVADLHAFDLKMGIADPPSFKVVNETGGSAASVQTDAGWAGEIALDVEWAHAIAPGANILLVSANSDSIPDLMSAVDVARRAAGVSVVSMSWGLNEFSGQTYWDRYFTTPAGHQGVTFVAASGDDGSSWGVNWPSSSPNVVAVGGTSLYTTGTSGTYSTETGWSGSGGGISQVYRTPSYQAAAQSTGLRTNPDVSYDANPNTGFAVYDSVPYSGEVGWQVIGGTSAGTPQWAALIALANQSRAAVGKASLDGATATLPALYKLYSAPGTASYATYTANFNDVVSGASSWSLRAHTGYDGVTGLGSPKAPQVVSALTSFTATVTTTTTTVARTRAQRIASRVAAAATAAAARQTSTSTTLASLASSEIISAQLLMPDAHRLAMQQNVSSSARALMAIDASNSLPSAAAPSVSSSAPLHSAFSQTAITFDAATFAASSASRAFDVTNFASPSIAVAIGAAQSAIPAALQLESSISVAAFADALSTFTHESAAIGAAFMENSPTHLRTWAIAAAVLGIDGILIASWAGSRRRPSANRKNPSASNRPNEQLSPTDDDDEDRSTFSIKTITR